MTIFLMVSFLIIIHRQHEKSIGGHSRESGPLMPDTIPQHIVPPEKVEQRNEQTPIVPLIFGPYAAIGSYRCLAVVKPEVGPPGSQTMCVWVGGWV